MKKMLIAGNWKMNGSLAANEALILALRSGLPPTVACQVALCVPAVYLAQVQGLLADSGLDLGAQTGKMGADERASPSRGRDARTLRTVFVSGEIAAKNLAPRRF